MKKTKGIYHSSYIEEFNNYAKRKVYECPTELSPVTDSGQAIIYVTLDESYDDCTLSHLRLLHGKLCQILQIPSKGVLRLCRIESGSIKLVFSLPERLLKDIFPLSYGKKMLLLSFKITKLSHCSHHYSQPYSEFNVSNCTCQQCNALYISLSIIHHIYAYICSLRTCCQH